MSVQANFEDGPLSKRENSTCSRVIRHSILLFCLTFAGAVALLAGPHTVTLTGRVSCSICLLPNTCKAQGRNSCVSWWVNQGSSYALIVGTRHYRLLNADKELKGLAGRTVTVTGEQFRSDVTVATVE
jgi:hypothetical protein